MTFASMVVEIRVFKGSNIAFQYTRFLTDQPRPSKLSNCLCLNRLNITSRYNFGINGCLESCVQVVKHSIPIYEVLDLST